MPDHHTPPAGAPSARDRAGAADPPQIERPARDRASTDDERVGRDRGDALPLHRAADVGTPTGPTPTDTDMRAHDLADAIATVGQIVRELFGDRAYTHPVLQRNIETGEEEFVVEAHYGLAPDAPNTDDDFARDGEVLRLYLQRVPPEKRRQMTLLRLAV